MKLKQFKHELRGNYSSDKWGEVMSAFFQIASHLWSRDIDAPREWQYRPGILGDAPDKEESYYYIFKKCSDRQLLIIGSFLYRLSNILEKAGLSY